jgi:hypothetical protein
MPIALLEYFCILTHSFIGVLQVVSAPCLVKIFLSPDLSFYLSPPVGECLSFSQILSV